MSQGGKSLWGTMSCPGGGGGVFCPVTSLTVSLLLLFD